MQLNIRVFGRNYDQAHRLPGRLDLPEGCTLTEALRRLIAEMPADHSLPATCLVAVSGIHRGTVGNPRECPLHDGDELLILEPVAGG